MQLCGLTDEDIKWRVLDERLAATDPSSTHPPITPPLPNSLQTTTLRNLYGLFSPPDEITSLAQHDFLKDLRPNLFQTRYFRPGDHLNMFRSHKNGLAFLNLEPGE